MGLLSTIFGTKKSRSAGGAAATTSKSKREIHDEPSVSAGGGSSSSHSSSTTSLGLGTNKTPSRESPRKSKRCSEKMNPPSTSTVNPNVELAKKLVDVYNSNDLTVKAVTKLFVCDNKKRYIFEDGQSLKVGEVAQAQILIRKSFPDFKFNYTSMEVLLGPNTVTIEGLQASGTHTGEPFTYAPTIPAIPATGIHCANDEERAIIEFDDETGKIKTIRVISMGTKTGLIGLYEQIGGGSGGPPQPAAATSLES